MGEVFRARDTKLNRTVAIKAMHDTGLDDPERVKRFEREAQLLASLNHPNIAAIHGLEEAGGAAYLVLEFIDGRPLSDLLREGPLPADEALRLAKGIADALAAAHERGIIHRDLKPGNVMITADGQPKVLDFGLGKAIEGDGAPKGDASPANSPTMTLAATQAGIILGTAGYMSPEQARGRAADRRSDVWAFGCLLFEMLAGRRAFEGEDITDTLAAIVRGEPDWSALPAGTPRGLHTLIERCLIKDRSERLPDMSVVRFILNERASIAAAEAATPTASAPARRSIGLPAAGGLLAAAVVVTAGLAALWWGGAPAVTSGVSRLTVVLPDGDRLADARLAPVAISPDGRMLTYAGVRNGRQQLFVRELAEAEPRALAGTDAGYGPFFRPDGQWIGFFAEGKLKKVAVTGTGLEELAGATFGRGATWSADDTIYFTPGNITGLWKVPASGGPAAEVTSLDRERGEISHRWPSVAADGRSVLFSVWNGPGPDEHWIEHLSLGDGTRTVLARNVEGPAATVGGFLITGGRLDSPQAVPWRGPQDDLTGVAPIDLPFSAQSEGEGAAAYSVSRDGTFAYVNVARQTGRLAWIDRTGRTEVLPVPEGPYVAAALSPDGRQAALHVSSGTKEIWLYDFATETLVPLVNTGGSSQAPLWSADGQYVIYRGTRSGFRNLFRKAADGFGSRTTADNEGRRQSDAGVSDLRWQVAGLRRGRREHGWRRRPVEGSPGRRGGTEPTRCDGRFREFRACLSERPVAGLRVRCIRSRRGVGATVRGRRRAASDFASGRCRTTLVARRPRAALHGLGRHHDGARIRRDVRHASTPRRRTVRRIRELEHQLRRGQ